MSAEANEREEELVARQALEIERMKDALGLLGVAPCAWCKKFLRKSEPGQLFDAGDLICYGCIPEWWAQRREQLSAKDCENLEGKLVFWLRDYHHAETFKDPTKLPESSQQEVCVIANCLECKGTGKSLGQDSCRFCQGRGTVWVVVSRKKD
jgi:hypothetical protein